MSEHSQSGSGWTMILGDCVDVLHSLQCEADAVVADPPYSSGGFTRGDRTVDPITKYKRPDAIQDEPTFSGDNRDQRGYMAWSALWLRAATRVLKKSGPVCIWTDWRQLPVTTDALQAGGMVWRGIAVWTKQNASRPQLGRFRSDAEFVVWRSLGPMPTHRGVGVLPGSWTCPPVPVSERLHLTEKPIQIMMEVVQIVPVGGLVLDPFAGSGSTGVACLSSGRRFIGIEHDRIYFEMACDRLRAEEKSSTLRAATGGQVPLFGGEQ